MKELQEAIKTTKAYWPSLKQMRKNRNGKRDSRVGQPPIFTYLFPFQVNSVGVADDVEQQGQPDR